MPPVAAFHFEATIEVPVGIVKLLYCGIFTTCARPAAVYACLVRHPMVIIFPETDAT